MGANQSKTPLPNEKLLIERLQALQTDDYVHVQVNEKDAASTKSFKAPWTDLSVSEIEHVSYHKFFVLKLFYE